MNCKDCLHYEVCGYEKDGVTYCANFKNKSKFIELPCKIGDIYTFIHNSNVVDEIEIKSIEFVKDRVLISYQSEDHIHRGTISTDFFYKFFIPKAEAEAKLNDLNENE